MTEVRLVSPDQQMLGIPKRRKFRDDRYLLNLNLANYYGDGYWEIPRIRPEKYEPIEKWVPFHKANTTEARSKRGLHFYTDDYAFDRVWYRLERYTELLQQFAAVIAPDWSLYTDWPPAVNIWNHYRNQFVGRWLQDHGVKVYPNICWTDEKSFEWCFLGAPKGSTVALTSQCSMMHKESRKLFIQGFHEMEKRLEPETILIYGHTIPDECQRDNIILIPTWYKTKFAKKYQKEESGNEGPDAEAVL